jgi:hypothetical protein
LVLGRKIKVGKIKEEMITMADDPRRKNINLTGAAEAIELKLRYSWPNEHKKRLIFFFFFEKVRKPRTRHPFVSTHVWIIIFFLCFFCKFLFRKICGRINYVVRKM